jgi:transposase
MAAALVPGALWSLIRGFSQLQCRSRKVVDLAGIWDLTHFVLLIERTFAWLNQFRRLRLRYEKRADMHKALLSLACALICWNFLQGHFP